MNINTLNSGSGRNNQGPGGDELSFGDKVKMWWADVPLFVKFVMITSTITYILSWVVPSFIEALANIPLNTITKFRIWSLATSSLVQAQILNLLFSFLFWVPHAIRLENTSGTVRYLLCFFVNSMCIQVIFIVFCLLLSLMSSMFLMSPSIGLWPFLMSEITLLSLAHPENPMQLFMIPYTFKAKYYPWALFAFWSLLNMSISFDNLAGIVFGYIYFYKLRERLSFSDRLVYKIENYKVVKYFSTFSGFIPLQSSNINLSVNMENNQGGAGTWVRDQPKNEPVTTPFKGKGTVLGIYF
jgi:membrane associated rhomboid family serine protease